MRIVRVLISSARRGLSVSQPVRFRRQFMPIYKVYIALLLRLFRPLLLLPRARNFSFIAVSARARALRNAFVENPLPPMPLPMNKNITPGYIFRG